jgi:hypothetical protein
MSTKQTLIHAVAALLETAPTQLQDITRYGECITAVLADYDFTPADSLAAATALADSLGIEEEEETGREPCPAIVNLSEGALHPYPHPEWERASEYDLRFHRGDAYAADGWRHVSTGHIHRTVVGSGAPTLESDLNTIHPAYIQNPAPPTFLRDTSLMTLIEQSDL